MEALAAEGAVYGGPAGGSDIRSANLPPQTGLYIGAVTIPGVSTSASGDDGRKNAALREVNLSYLALAIGALYVYPFRVAGGAVASAVQTGYYPYARLSINGRTDRITGWADLYADIFSWSRFLGHMEKPPSDGPALPYGLTARLSYSMIFPIGAYNTHQLTTPGHNDYFFVPNAAATYLTRPTAIGDGLEFSARLFMDMASQNTATHYSTGTVLDLDFAVSERIGLWQVGIAGVYAVQLDDDRREGHSVPANGRRLETLALGPIAQLDIPKWGAVVKLKLRTPLYNRNVLNMNQAILTIGFRAF